MLWDLFKNTAYPIYINSMEEDLSNMPDNFVVLEEQAFDEAFKHADGMAKLRRRTFNIRFHFVDTSTLDTAVASYRSILSLNNITFTQAGPVRDPGTKYHSVLITGSYVYG